MGVWATWGDNEMTMGAERNEKWIHWENAACGKTRGCNDVGESENGEIRGCGTLGRRGNTCWAPTAGLGVLVGSGGKSGEMTTFSLSIIKSY